MDLEGEIAGICRAARVASRALAPATKSPLAGSLLGSVASIKTTGPYNVAKAGMVVRVGQAEAEVRLVPGEHLLGFRRVEHDVGETDRDVLPRLDLVVPAGRDIGCTFFPRAIGISLADLGSAEGLYN